MASRKSKPSPEVPVTWREVRKVVSDGQALSSLVSKLAAAKFSVYQVDGNLGARLVLLESLIRVEDKLEMEGRGKLWDAHRLSIRAVRRRLECEVWP